MTRKNQVEVLLTAKDEISATVRNLKGNIAGIGTGFRSALLPAAALTGAVTAMAAAMMTVGKLSEGLKSASDMQLKAIGAANSLRIGLNISLPEGKNIIADLQSSIADKALQLPIEAKDAYGILSQVSGSLSAVYKNVEQFKQKASEDVINISLIAKGSGLNSDQGAEAFNKTVMGKGSFDELAQLEFFEKNSQLFNAYKDQIKSFGFTDKNNAGASAAVRLTSLERAQKSIVTPEYMANLENTVGGKFNSLTDMFFDDTKGIFGWARILTSSTNKQGLKVAKTALTSVTSFLDNVGGLAKAMGKYGTSNGFGFDPMLAISSLFDTFSKTVKDVRDIFVKGGDIWNDLTFAFIRKTSDSLNNLSKVISSVGWEKMGKDFGLSIWKILNSEEFATALYNTTLAAVTALGDAIWGAIDGVAKEVQKGILNPTEKWINKGMHQATFGGLGYEKEGEKNGYQRTIEKIGEKLNILKEGLFPVIKPATTPVENQTGLKPATKDMSSSNRLPRLEQMSYANSTKNSIVNNLSITVADATDFNSDEIASQLLASLNNKFVRYRDISVA